MRLLAPLLLLLGIAQAQLTFPLGNFTTPLSLKGDGPSYEFRRGKVTLETLDGLLFRIGYQGPASDAQAAGDLLANGLGNAQLSTAFVSFMRTNATALKGKGPKAIGVGNGYQFILELSDQLSITLAPEQASNFGADSHILGEKGIAIREFADFECPYCRQLAQQVLPLIRSRYVDTGQARLIFRHFPLTEIHPNALPAAIASECAADQGQFFTYHDALYERGLNTTANARELGLDEARFAQCVAGPEARARVMADRAQSQLLQIQGTPTVYVGPFLLPNPFDLAAYERYLRLARAVEARTPKP